MKIKAGLFPLMLILSLIVSHSAFSLIVLGAALLHELGHIVAAHLLGIRLTEMGLGIFGASLSTESTLYSYKKEILLCAAGPFTNLICAAVTYYIAVTGDTLTEYPVFFIFASLSLAIINLLPVSGFDGGRILSSLLLCRLSPRTVSKIISSLSFICVFSLWCVSLYLLLRSASSLSLFIFSVALFARLFVTENS